MVPGEAEAGQDEKGGLRTALAGLTTRGRSFLAAGIAAAVCAYILGQSDLLQIGVLLAAFVTLVGGALVLAKHGGTPADYRVFRGEPDALGWIRDISEHGVRAHFADVDLTGGDEIVLRILLEDEIVEIEASVTKTGSLRQSIPRRGPMSVEVVAVFDTDEHQAQAIRRYVLRQQMLSRTRSAIV